MDKPLTNRQMKLRMILAASLLAVASLLLGLTAGHAMLRSIGLGGFADMLDGIPVSSAVVTSVFMPLVYAIGIGLSWKGWSESLMRSTVRGSVVSSSIRVVPRDPSDGFRLHSRVAYRVDGVAYETEGPHEEILPLETAAKKRLEALHPGDPVTVYYKPGDPGVINLDAPPGRTLLVRLVGLWITISGIGATFLNGVVFR